MNSELKYLKDELGDKVKFDRRELLVDLLTKRASTKEAHVQVEYSIFTFKVD